MLRAREFMPQGVDQGAIVVSDEGRGIINFELLEQIVKLLKKPAEA